MSTVDITDLEEMTDSTEVRLTGGLVQVTLACPRDQRASTLGRWTDVITVADMTCGKYRASDRALRLHLRGQLPTGTPIVVTAVYDERVDSDAVSVIRRYIEQQDVPALLSTLAQAEGFPSP